uniref:Receptor activity modifying protein 2 n=1 Tax=Serinus canaria TaxID=9135 RepID=A0A8C9UBI9_SERCA
MPAGAGTARDSAGSRRESRFGAALSNLIFHTSPVVKLPLSEERSCFLLFPLKSLSRSLAGRLWQDGTAHAHELRPSLPRAPAALRAPGDWPLSHRHCDNKLQPGHWDKPTHSHIQLDSPAHGPYSELQLCLEEWAERLNHSYPNALAEQYIFQSHHLYFHNCTLEHPVYFDPPEDVLLAMIIAPICLIPFLVTLVIWRSKDGKAQA